MLVLRDNIYYVSDLDILVLYKREDTHVTVFDIVGKHVPVFSEIYPYISSENDRTIEFSFMADKMGLENPDYIRVKDNGTHLLGDFPLDNTKFIFPLTAQA